MRIGHLAAVAAVLVVGAALATPRPATAAPGLVVGAVEDDVRASTLVEAEAKMMVFRLAGFRAVRVTTYWTPGLDAPTDGELQVLKSVAGAAEMNGVRVYVTVMHPGSRTTPLTDEARAEFASYAATIVREAPYIHDVIVANEPNLNRFWLPQFNARRLERLAGRVPRAARTRLRRAEGGVTRRHRVRRRRLAARRRQP